MSLGSILRVLLAAYLLLCVLVWIFQAKLIWMPLGRPGPPPEQFGLAKVEEVWLQSADGLRLHAWWIQAPGVRDAAVVSHGNAGNLEHRSRLARGLVRAGLNVLLYDYRGYGRSEGSPDEEGSYLDAEAAWSFLVEDRGVPPERLVSYGESLGGAVAIELAGRRRCGALVVESSFTSLGDMAAAAYPFLPGRWLLRSDYASRDKIGGLELPVLVAHGRDDRVVPYVQGRALFEAAPDPKDFVELEGGHNDGGLMALPDGPQRLRGWLDQVWR